MRPDPLSTLLLLSAFVAGTVDVISFGLLGGVFASAMTGNFALLAYYIAEQNQPAALGSIVALVGFVLGCALGVLQRRGRTVHEALTRLLLTEGVLLLIFGLSWLWTPHAANAPADHLHILLLSVAMGIQAIASQALSLTTIVFTTTLSKLVGTVTDAIANGDAPGIQEVRTHVQILLSYLFGALLAGSLIVRSFDGVVLLPVMGIGAAFAVHRYLSVRPR
jgi:uncharacterized membrane protein YoaK (UPF0700 family)